MIKRDDIKVNNNIVYSKQICNYLMTLNKYYQINA